MWVVFHAKHGVQELADRAVVVDDQDFWLYGHYLRVEPTGRIAALCRCAACLLPAGPPTRDLIWNLEHEGRAFADLTLYSNFPAMALRDFFYEREAQAETAPF